MNALTATRSMDLASTLQGIADLEALIVQSGNALTMEDFKTDHEFAHGLYRRTLYIPKDTVMTSCEHKYSHMASILDGIVEVRSATENVRYVGPCQFITPAGTKRALYAVTNVVWSTVHSVPLGLTDIDELVAYLVTKRFHKDSL